MNDLDVARDDLALDALGGGRLPDGADDALGLLHALRTDLDPVAEVVPLRPRRPRRAALIALSAAAGLVVGGATTGAVVAADQPGQLLYAAHEALLGDTDDGERVTKLLDDAAEELAEGDVRAAARRLDQATDRLGDVEDAAERDALSARLARLRAVLAGLGPAATPAPRPTESPETDEPRETESPETEDPDDDRSGSNSGSGSGSDDPDDSDNSGSGSLNSGSGSDGGGGDSSGKGSDDVLKTPDPDDARDSDSRDSDDS